MCNMNDSCWIYHLILISCALIWKEILHYSTHFSTTKLKHEAFISKISYMYRWYMGFVNIIEKKCKFKKKTHTFKVIYKYKNILDKNTCRKKVNLNKHIDIYNHPYIFNYIFWSLTYTMQFVLSTGFFFHIVHHCKSKGTIHFSFFFMLEDRPWIYEFI